MFLMGWVSGIVTLTLVMKITNTSPRIIEKKFQMEAFDRGYMEKVITEHDNVEYKWK